MPGYEICLFRDDASKPVKTKNYPDSVSLGEALTKLNGELLAYFPPNSKLSTDAPHHGCVVPDDGSRSTEMMVVQGPDGVYKTEVLGNA